MMRLVERHVIKRADPRFTAMDRAAFASKNLYNKALYATRQAFFQDGSPPSYPSLYHHMKGEPEYAALPRKVAQWVLKQVCTAWDSYKEALAAWGADPSKFLDQPRIPRYKPKQQGRNLLVYTTQALSQPALRNSLICPSGLGITVQTQQSNVQQVRIIPRMGIYVAEVIYKQEPAQAKVAPALHAGVDIGLIDHSPQLKPGGFLGCSQRTRPAHPKVKRCDRLTRALRTWVSSSLHRRTFPQALRYGTQSTTRRARAPCIPSPQGRGLLAEKDNLALLTSDKPGFVPRLVNGRPVKSINQFYNKRRAELQSRLGDAHTSRRLARITTKRTQRIDWYLHTASRRIIDLLVAEGIGTLCIGKNPLWKQQVNMGRRNNQNFVSVPHARFIALLTYKADLVGIRVCVTEESYTSKASFLDGDPLQVYDPTQPAPAFNGRRVKRGLYRAADGRHIKADANGSDNTTRTLTPDAFARGGRGGVGYPRRAPGGDRSKVAG